MWSKFSTDSSTLQTFPLTTTSSQWVSGALCPALKRLERDTDHLPKASAEFKNMWIYTSTPPLIFMAGYLVKHRNNLYLDCMLREGEIKRKGGDE
jgi:hypothetical protein